MSADRVDVRAASEDSDLEEGYAPQMNGIDCTFEHFRFSTLLIDVVFMYFQNLFLGTLCILPSLVHMYCFWVFCMSSSFTLPPVSILPREFFYFHSLIPPVLNDQRYDIHKRTAMCLRYYRFQKAALCVDHCGAYPIIGAYAAAIVITPIVFVRQFVKLYMFFSYYELPCSQPLAPFLLIHALVDVWLFSTLLCQRPEDWVIRAGQVDFILTIVGIVMVRSVGPIILSDTPLVCQPELVHFTSTYLHASIAVYIVIIIFLLYLQVRFQFVASNAVLPSYFSCCSALVFFSLPFTKLSLSLSHYLISQYFPSTFLSARVDASKEAPRHRFNAANRPDVTFATHHGRTGLQTVIAHSTHSAHTHSAHAHSAHRAHTHTHTHTHTHSRTYTHTPHSNTHLFVYSHFHLFHLPSSSNQFIELIDLDTSCATNSLLSLLPTRVVGGLPIHIPFLDTDT